MVPPLATSVEQLLAVLAQGRGQNDGEDVDLLDHGLQCAAILGHQEPHDRELQAAGLVHDLGTVLWPNRPKTHARSGAAFVEPVLGPVVAWLVAHHDEAKRFLVTIDPEYRDRLSPRSVATLEAQGGLLSARECARFRAAPLVDQLVKLRLADDLAKVPGRTVADLDSWRGTLERVARGQMQSA